MRALVITTPRAHVEVISDRLWTLGVAAIEERPCTTTSGDAVETVETVEMVELWTALGEDPDPAREALARVGLTPHPGPGPETWWRWEEVDASSAETWRDHVEEFEIVPGLRIVPSWRVARTTPVDAGEILLDPGAAFGMGDHPTTALSLALLLDTLHTGDHLVDLGCGSGILGIAALRRGAARVTAIDIAPAALEATRANAERNGVLAQVATATEWMVHHRPADLVVANILTPTLIELSPMIRTRATGARAIILSGVLSTHIERISAAFAPWTLEHTAAQAGWAALRFRPPADDPARG